VGKLRSGGELSEEEHSTLEILLEAAAAREPGMVAQVAFKQEVYSGPLPHFEQLNGYDDQTRRIIVEMAAKEQEHGHQMQRRGLLGAIWRDRIAQLCAVSIALGGFWAAVEVAGTSATAATVIAGFDILALVCAFIAPRALEMIIEGRSAPNPPSKKKPVKKRS
jgi:uncharacterized membrane protein